MILVNRNFGNPALSTVIGDMFKSTSDASTNYWMNHSNGLVTGSSLVSTFASATAVTNNITAYGSTYPRNIFIVTEQFIKVLDKVYTKIWNESFTETGIYNVSNLSTLYNAFVTDTSNGAASAIGIAYSGSYVLNNFMLFVKFVDRAIAAGVLDETDRLNYEDQITIVLNKGNLSTQVDLANKLITFTSAQPMDVIPDIDSREGTYLHGKKLFLMMTPHLHTAYTSTGSTASNQVAPYEPFQMSPYKLPLAFFKPKTSASKYGRSLPLATHFFWRIGTPEEKEMALLEGKTGIDVPEIIFDHLDRISHIDSFVLKVKYDKLQF